MKVIRCATKYLTSAPRDLANSTALFQLLTNCTGPNCDSDSNIEDRQRAADRPVEGQTKLQDSPEGLLPWMDKATDDETWPTVATAVGADLGAVFARAIPKAVKLESLSWTISDYPNTVGERLTTLDVGSLEVLYIPREPFELLDDHRNCYSN